MSILCPVKRLKFWDCPGRACPAPAPSTPLTFAFSIPAAPLKAQSWWTLRENEEVADGAGVRSLSSDPTGLTQKLCFIEGPSKQCFPDVPRLPISKCLGLGQNSCQGGI